MTPLTNITYHLEMHSPDELLASAQKVEIELRQEGALFSQQMYMQVGVMWRWNDRRDWTTEQWEELHGQGATRTYAGIVDGEVIGYFELDLTEENESEIIYFGLLPDYIGKGLGGAFLTKCIETAWSQPATRRVWVHTCTFDHEHALANYQARGFKLFKTEES